MSYRLIERSTYGLNPVECYFFSGSSDSWRYTSADQDIILDGETYTAIPITRTKVENTTDIHKSNLKCSLPKDNELAIQTLLNQSDDIIQLTIYRVHQTDLTDWAVEWKGRVSGAQMPNNSGKIDIECESIFTSLRRIGVRLKDTRLCNATLYDHRCNVDKTSYAYAGAINALNSKVNLIINSAADKETGYFTGGYASFSGVLRHIIKHEGSQIILIRPVYGLSVTDSVTLYPGCDRRHQTCIDKFDNLENFRGAPWIPTRNPFDGSSIV